MLDFGQSSKQPYVRRSTVARFWLIGSLKAGKKLLYCSVFSASITSAAWPLDFAVGQILSTFPSGPIKTVLRTIPRYDLPRKLFIRRAPYGSMTEKSGSLSNGKFRFCLVLNFA